MKTIGKRKPGREAVKIWTGGVKLKTGNLMVGVGGVLTMTEHEGGEFFDGRFRLNTELA